MTDEFKIDVYKKAIDYYGTYEQHSVAMEECSELIQAISKFLRADKPKDMLIARNHIREEIADVMIMIDQLRLMHSIGDKEMEQEVEYKVMRLKKRVEYGSD